ncbi:conjugative transposon protein TraN [Pedobacter sp. ASV28]|uniref:conjugative transposon protein TraN n=1 Tax=Pedobacter sp. ASV28 TaxID=2795123 RepID=UPI0018EC85DF|nr:conjugative transposon protein TraN [Pedobacter sp. ASV28]
MKSKSGVWVVCLFMLLSFKMFAQNEATKVNSTIEPLLLTISNNKTTNLIFPYAITSVDRGNKDVLVQKAQGVENILQVKAANSSLTETNLTIVLADGSLYSFILNYASEPSKLNFIMDTRDKQLQAIGILLNGSDNEARIKQIAEKVLSKKGLMKRPKDNQYDIGVKLLGLYVNEGNLLFQLSLSNSSNIRYDIDQLRFYIRDKKVAKRTAAQELEIIPVHILGNQKFIEIQSLQNLVFVVPKFTIPEQKYLSIEVMEKNGGRHLSLKIKNKQLIGANIIQ